jgi:hypothetical protein
MISKSRILHTTSPRFRRDVRLSVKKAEHNFDKTNRPVEGSRLKTTTGGGRKCPFQPEIDVQKMTEFGRSQLLNWPTIA